MITLDQLVRELPPLELSEKIYVVEAGLKSTDLPIMHSPYKSVNELLVQILGGLMPSKILYIGQDRVKAEHILDIYTEASKKVEDIDLEMLKG